MPRDQFVQIQHRPGDGCRRGQQGWTRDVWRLRGLACAHEPSRAVRVRGKTFQVAVVEATQNGTLLRRGSAIQRTIENPLEPRPEALAAVRDGVLREDAPGFDVNR